MKKRVDMLLVERRLTDSREKAQRLIRAGLVHTADRLLDKPGLLVEEDIPLTIKGAGSIYVSRGGEKLQGALEAFHHDPQGQTALDLGASTGGFTDCLLQRGAALVYAVDVGRGQLHVRLRNNPRVINWERTHLDMLEPGMFKTPPDLAVGDLSFISLRRAFPVLRRILPAGARAILLVKPQFEVGRERLPRGGVVTDRNLQRQVLDDMATHARTEAFDVLDTCESPITGMDGNREFFLYLARKAEAPPKPRGLRNP